ncbi:hypothetical protein [Massilia sp. LjRoot122]|uniref:hypothetical protein n=1 Tax=Massilia sp. LjRoot122 TaxID=3342257 RepID=UPI003ED13F17
MTHQFSFPGKPVRIALRGSMLAFGLLAGAAASAAAPDDKAPTWKFSGFGTLGVAHASIRNADFTSTVLHATGAGLSDRWSPHVDSRLGAQLDVSQGRWSGVLQLLSEQGPDGSYRPRVEWANVKYQLTPDLAVRAGRIALPSFLAADYRKIGYVLPWVRTPVEMYGLLPVSSSDGVDATWRWSGGSMRNTTQVFYGYTDTVVYSDIRLKARGIAGLSHSIERGALSARMSALTARLNSNLASDMYAAMRGFGPQGAALAEHYAIEDKRMTILSAGINYDPGQWFVLAEIGRTHTRSSLGETTSMYAGGGYRFASLTPFISCARVRADSPISDPGLDLDGLPPQQQALGALLNAGLNYNLATIPVQSSVSAGLRWDAAENVAFKVQYDRLRPTGGSRGTLINRGSEFRSGQTVHVASMTLDFVF